MNFLTFYDLEDCFVGNNAACSAKHLLKVALECWACQPLNSKVCNSPLPELYHCQINDLIIITSNMG